MQHSLRFSWSVDCGAVDGRRQLLCNCAVIAECRTLLLPAYSTSCCLAHRKQCFAHMTLKLQISHTETYPSMQNASPQPFGSCKRPLTRPTTCHRRPLLICKAAAPQTEVQHRQQQQKQQQQKLQQQAATSARPFWATAAAVWNSLSLSLPAHAAAAAADAEISKRAAAAAAQTFAPPPMPSAADQGRLVGGLSQRLDAYIGWVAYGASVGIVCAVLVEVVPLIALSKRLTLQQSLKFSAGAAGAFRFGLSGLRFGWVGLGWLKACSSLLFHSSILKTPPSPTQTPTPDDKPNQMLRAASAGSG